MKLVLVVAFSFLSMYVLTYIPEVNDLMIYAWQGDTSAMALVAILFLGLSFLWTGMILWMRGFNFYVKRNGEKIIDINL